MSIRLYCVVLDTDDAERLAVFYRDFLGWDYRYRDMPFIGLNDPVSGFGITIQQEEDYLPPVWPARPGEQQMMAHLDFSVGSKEELDAAVEKALALGAKTAPEQFGGEEWTTLIDPAGHPLCIGVWG